MCSCSHHCITDCRCICHKNEPELKLEVGRTYLNGYGDKVLILNEYDGYYVGSQSVISSDFPRYYKNGRRAGREEGIDNRNLVKEYKEPVTHRRDIIWYLFGTSNGVDRLETMVREVGYHLGSYSDLEVHRQTVEYTERG